MLKQLGKKLGVSSFWKNETFSQYFFNFTSLLLCFFFLLRTWLRKNKFLMVFFYLKEVSSKIMVSVGVYKFRQQKTNKKRFEWFQIRKMRKHHWRRHTKKLVNSSQKMNRLGLRVFSTSSYSIKKLKNFIFFLQNKKNERTQLLLNRKKNYKNKITPTPKTISYKQKYKPFPSYSKYSYKKIKPILQPSKKSRNFVSKKKQSLISTTLGGGHRTYAPRLKKKVSKLFLIVKENGKKKKLTKTFKVLTLKRSKKTIKKILIPFFSKKKTNLKKKLKKNTRFLFFKKKGKKFFGQYAPIFSLKKNKKIGTFSIQKTLLNFTYKNYRRFWNFKKSEKSKIFQPPLAFSFKKKNSLNINKFKFFSKKKGLTKEQRALYERLLKCRFPWKKKRKKKNLKISGIRSGVFYWKVHNFKKFKFLRKRQMVVFLEQKFNFFFQTRLRFQYYSIFKNLKVLKPSFFKFRKLLSSSVNTNYSIFLKNREGKEKSLKSVKFFSLKLASVKVFRIINKQWWRFRWFSAFIDFVNIANFSFFFLKADFLPDIIRRLIFKRQNVARLLWSLARLLFFYYPVYCVSPINRSLRLSITGKLGGQRKRKFRNFLFALGARGSPQKVGEASDFCFTGFWNYTGSFGLKTWMFNPAYK